MDIGNEIVAVEIDAHLYPKLTVQADKETGELIPAVFTSNSKTKKLQILLHKNGTPIYPFNIYLHHLISKRGIQKTTTHTKALLLYVRWLHETRRNYKDITENPKEGVAWQFGDWLIDHNLRSVNEESGEIHNENGLAISTARSYMGVVIDFYKWLNREQILPWSATVKPFAFHTIMLSDFQRNNDNHMLSHTMKRRAIVVTTTDRLKSFPKVQSIAQWQKLKPLSQDDQKNLESYVNNDDPKSLMVKLAMYGGLRISEVVTLSEAAIYAPVEDICKLKLDPADGVLTKNSKQRTTEIPKALMQVLYEYKLSSERLTAISSDHRRLFITNDGKQLNVNTLETFWSKLRKNINQDMKSRLDPNDKRLLSKKPLWYYRFHDLRATFATNWLRLNQQTRNTTFEFLFQELKKLMGHELNTDTQKYIDFVNHFDVFVDASARRNSEAAIALRGK